jgi:hypothetical protein
MLRVLIAAVIWVVAACQSFAWTHGAVTGATGQTQMNAGPLDSMMPFTYLNMLKASGLSFGGGATPGSDPTTGAQIDSNGYVTKSFSGTVSLLNATSTNSWLCAGSVTCTFVWTAGTKLAILNNVASSNCVLTGTGGSVTGCSSNSLTLTIDGTGAGTLTFNSPTGLSLSYVPGGSYGSAGTANLALVRTSDLSAFQNATYIAANDARGIYTPEFLTWFQALNLKTVRGMDWNNTNISNAVQPQYVNKLTGFTWQGKNYPPTIWGGTITGTDAYTSPAGTDTPLAGWVDGEMLQGSFQNAPTQITISGATNNGSGLCRLTVSKTTTLTTGQQAWSSGINGATGCTGIFTITVIDAACSSACRVDLQSSTFGGTYTSGGALGTQTLTVTGKSGGAKFMASTGCLPLLSNFDTFSTGIGTLSYNALCDRVIYSTGGIVGVPPMEVQASLANYLKVNLWYPYGAFASNSFITSTSTTALTSLNVGLKFMPEYSNEVWNTSFQQTAMASQIGSNLGFPITTVEAVFGWYGLRTKQMMDLVKTAWASRLSDVRGVLAFQAFSDPPQNKKYRFEGFDLAPSGTSTGKGNALYTSYTGGADYTTAPNRPIDAVETLAYAPYTAGNNFSDQGLNGGTVAAARNAPVLQTLATAFAANPNDPVALALLDNDQRGLIPSTGDTVNITCPTGNTFTATNDFDASSGSRRLVIFSVSGGTICNGLTAGKVYCIANSTPSITTFQVSTYVASTGLCGTPISVTPGTGTVTAAPTNTNNLAALDALIFPEWESAAAVYNKRVEWYEGSSQPVVPTVATLTTIGVTVSGSATNAFNALTAGLIAYKNDPLSAAFMNSYYNTAEAYSHTRTPSNLSYSGPYSAVNPYGLTSGPLPTAPIYQTGAGVAAWVGANGQ